MTIGSTASGLRAVTKRTVRYRMAFLGRWRRHGLEETGNMQRYLPQLHDQEGD